MAPPSGSSKPRKAGASKQPGPKPVVPALPLPYVKRQATPAAAAAVTTTTTTTAAASASAPAAPTKQPNPPAPTDDKPLVNGTVDDEAVVGAAATPRASSAERAAESPAGARDDVKQAAAVHTNGHASFGIDGASQLSHRPNASTAATATAPAILQPAANINVLAQPLDVEIRSDTPPRFNGAAARPESTHQPAHYVPKHKARPSQSISPTRYQMPPPFQPSNRPLGIMAGGDLSRGPRPGPPHMHSAHPSNSSVHFGAFHDSQSSSPAPPHSGGIAPPPGMHLPDGRQPYIGHGGNGFPPMLPYGADMMPVTNFDSYGRPTAAYAPIDSYPPYGNGFGPSTPHSFHDSQSSAHPDDAGIYNQYQPPHRNGGPDDGQQNNQGRMFGPPDPRMVPSQGLPPHLMSPGDNADGLVGYLQQQFGSPDFADCTLELRFLDDRAPPVRIPGHRLIFARSAELSHSLRKQAQQSSPSDRSLQNLLVETDSKWVRSDSFYMAIQRLYGMPLLHVPPSRSGLDSGDVIEAGSATEQFEFALSYAAAGHLLDWSPIAKRGCEVATQLLSWQTLEKAFEYSLDGYTDKGSHETYTYGEGSRMILNAAVTFIVHNFPPTFSLDTLGPEPDNYARLPSQPPTPPTPTPAKAEVPTGTRGSSVQLGKGRRSQNLPHIQFGDLSLAEGKNRSPAETPKATQQAQPVSHTVLSRILLNIPFTQLKMILESAGSGNVNGWANAEARYRIIKSAVEEREARRLRLLEAVITGRVPGSDAIRAGLRSPGPQALGQWTALGWQEEILPYGNLDGRSLGRRWVPLMNSPHGSSAEYP